MRAKVVRQFTLAGALLLTTIGCGEQGQKIKKAYGLDAFDQPTPVAGGMMMGDIAAPAPPAKPIVTLPKTPPIRMGEIAPIEGPALNKKDSK